MNRLASRGVNANPDNANFGPGMVNTDDSINCGYTTKGCMRDNIETNYCPFTNVIN